MTEDEALFANDAFYLAFSHKDADAMERLWSQRHPVICIHPGWRAITNRDDMMESWRNILTNPRQPGIDFYNTRPHVVGSQIMVTCYEEIAGAVCVATNGFIEEDGDIRLFMHHSGPCSEPPAPISAPQSEEDES